MSNATSTAQAYEWVKTGHWSLRQFREWFEALAKQEQGEPVAWMSEDECIVYTSKQVDGCFQHDHIPLYTTPQQRTWVGLSVFEINELVENTEYEDYSDLVERTEAKLKEKNALCS